MDCNGLGTPSIRTHWPWLQLTEQPQPWNYFLGLKNNLISAQQLAAADRCKIFDILVYMILRAGF